ncbi:hypothetical protein AS96_05850 [Microbacterium sp. MRS-1]|nr:hypothetical protein AS96_05850 [Microbacterium sp. MRS-1]
MPIGRADVTVLHHISPEVQRSDAALHGCRTYGA